MKLLNNSEFSIKLISDATEIDAPKSQLVIDGKEVDSFIEGAVLEACVKHGRSYLIFTTNDCPYEESLNIYLLNQSYEILDNAVLIWPYNTGLFKILDITQSNLVDFKFFEDKIWQVELFSHKSILIPYISEPCGVWRTFRLKHHFKIRENCSKYKRT